MSLTSIALRFTDFGFQVLLTSDANYMVVSAPRATDSTNTPVGAVFLFKRNTETSTYDVVQSLGFPGVAANASCGWSMAMTERSTGTTGTTGTLLVVGE